MTNKVNKIGMVAFGTLLQMCYADSVSQKIIKPTPEERLRLDGGECQIRGRGWVAAIDCRPTPEPLDYSEGVKKIESDLCTVVSNRSGIAFSLQSAAEQVKNSGANVAVFIVEDPSLPFALSAPEDKWALVNAARLKIDLPDIPRFRKRLSVMFTRQCCRALGSDEGAEGDTCFRTVFSADDVDKITSLDLSYNAMIQITATMPLRGMEPIDWASYRDACRLGLAAPPVNDDQRRVWDEVHAPPKTPLKIKFDPATQKGKVTK